MIASSCLRRIGAKDGQLHKASNAHEINHTVIGTNSIEKACTWAQSVA